MPHWQQISDHINQTLAASFPPQLPSQLLSHTKAFQIKSKSSVGGGSINSSYHITGTNGQNFFVKLNSDNLEYMFQVEFDSLNELSQALSHKNSAMQIPHPICFGTSKCSQGNGQSYLVLEYLDMHSSGDGKKLGQALAEMHQITADQFGWHQNNIIGSTPQSNTRHLNWSTFWREERLRPQFEMLYSKGYKKDIQTLSDNLLNNLDFLLANHTPEASLLHGDLWSGNYGFNKQGQPVIFDPALYYGDRETDIAMTELFGGFSQDFYQAYNEIWPLDEAYTRRKTVYNLYHILNHANLFGKSYLNQAIGMMERLC